MTNHQLSQMWRVKTFLVPPIFGTDYSTFKNRQKATNANARDLLVLLQDPNWIRTESLRVCVCVCVCVMCEKSI